MKAIFCSCIATLLLVCLAVPASADQPGTAPTQNLATYPIQPGDLLKILVWDEENLAVDALVRPDGFLTMPLIGDVAVGGKVPAQVATDITNRLASLIADPVVTVAVIQTSGFVIYVIGQVNRPGELAMKSPLDVMQALSMAGGTTAFAKLGKIRILRREDGNQQTIDFDYTEVASGKKLAQNLILQSGDVVIVP